MTVDIDLDTMRLIARAYHAHYRANLAASDAAFCFSLGEWDQAVEHARYADDLAALAKLAKTQWRESR